MIRVALEEMEFFGYHGVYREEQENGNHFLVDVFLDVNIRVPSDDDLEEVVDYAAVYNTIREAMESRSNLLETLAARISKAIMEEFRQVAELTVRVSKLNPPLPGPCKRSYVELNRKRQ